MVMKETSLDHWEFRAFFHGDVFAVAFYPHCTHTHKRERFYRKIGSSNQSHIPSIIFIITIFIHNQNRTYFISPIELSILNMASTSSTMSPIFQYPLSNVTNQYSSTTSATKSNNNSNSYNNPTKGESTSTRNSNSIFTTMSNANSNNAAKDTVSMFSPQTPSFASHSNNPISSPMIFVQSPMRNGMESSLEEAGVHSLGLRRRPTVVTTSGIAQSSHRNTPDQRLPPPKLSRLGQRSIPYTSSDALMKKHDFDMPSSSSSESIPMNRSGIMPTHGMDFSIMESKPSVFAKKETTALVSLTHSPISYERWVLVYGITPQNVSLVLSKFQSLGTVISQYPETFPKDTARTTSTAIISQPSESYNVGNWICLQYKTVLEAEKASCQHPSILNLPSSTGTMMSGPRDYVVIGVLPMDETMANRLKLKQYLQSKRNDPLDDGSSTIFPRSDGNNLKKVIWAEEDVLYENHATNEPMRNGAAKDVDKKSEVCEKIMKWIFSW